ncbi:MAG TPA: bifunctional cobalt-precorrin-7 (C(5))-methyltransferase/cobalt-precorrin-6B (C(15))-methyltransferase, partial [Lachnospiraceae bacterium]|nr:bifunctional cobalt-precorrin-7 (C(5))-methyltransferase/cobalt-precorrin-6B (C(15))-methyltransferase [Lachnospiraceae bacterium]
MLDKAGIKHTVCVASDYGESLIKESENVTLSKGRLDEEEMERLFKESLSLDGKGIVVDATHPYATKVTENIQSAAKKCGIRYIRVIRDITDDSAFTSNMKMFDDITSCAKAIGNEGNILLTTGSKELSDYCEQVPAEVKERTYVRILPSKESITICEDNGIAPSHIIAMHGPFSEGLNKEICLQYGIKHLVTKESGSRG